MNHLHILQYVIPSISVGLSIVSVWVAIKALTESSKANAIAQRGQEIESLNSYSEKLDRLESKYCPLLRKLRRDSSTCFQEIINQIDDFSEPTDDPRPFRHIVHDLVEVIEQVFVPRIGLNHPEFLFGRVKELFHLKWNVENERDKVRTTFSRSVFKKARFEDIRLYRSAEFETMVGEYFDRLNRPHDAYKMAIAQIRIILETLEENKAEIRSDWSELKNVSFFNRRRPIKLGSTEVGAYFYEWVSLLEFYDNIFLLEANITRDFGSNSADQVILILVTLKLLNKAPSKLLKGYEG